MVCPIEVTLFHIVSVGLKTVNIQQDGLISFKVRALLQNVNVHVKLYGMSH